MHIPDGLLDPYTIIATYGIAILILSYTIMRYRSMVSEFEIAKIAGLASSIFVAQLIKWPVPGGSTLHFVGGGLAGIVSGPLGGFIVMATVLAVQTFIFHDGGITAFGANIISAGVIGVWCSYLVYTFLKKTRAPFYIATFIAGYLSTVLTGLTAGFILGLSGEILGSNLYNLRITPTVMFVTHALLGPLEGLITMGVAEYIRSRNPSILFEGGRA